MRHCIRLAEAFQLVDVGRPSFEWGSTSSKFHSQNENEPTSQGEKMSLNNSNVDKGKQFPIFIYEPQKACGALHNLRACHECPEETRRSIFKQIAEDKKTSGATLRNKNTG